MSRPFAWMLFLNLLALCSFASAQGPLSRPIGDVLIESYLAQQTELLSSRELDSATSSESWEARRPKLKQQFFDMLGLWPLPEKTPLKATVTGQRERENFVVENVHFQSKPGLYVTGNLYRPKTIKPGVKLPTALYVCGHSAKGRDGNKTAFQQHGMWFATHGYVCLIIDTLQLGEVAGIHHGTYNKDRWWWHSAGYTSAGVECWNGVRAIDYLITRPDVDPQKIAVTGISGGGAATFWIAAADERVTACVPVSGMSDLQSYVTDKICNGHCDCMFFYNNYRWEWTTIAALIAPKPMLFENSGHDPIFPMGANERIRVRLEKLYSWYQKKPGDLFDIGITPGGHNDNVELRLMAYRWFNRHLKGDNAEVSEPTLPPFSGQDLRVFPEDSDLPKESLNAVIDETFVPVAKLKSPTNPAEYAQLKASIRDQLLSRVLVDWPEAAPGADLIGETNKGDAAKSKLLLRTDDEVVVSAKKFVPATVAEGKAKPTKLWLVVLNADDAVGQLPQWAKDFVKDSDISVVLSPRGTDPEFAWTRKNPPNYVERAHALLGRTVDAGRIWDVERVARWLHETDGNELTVSVIGRGQSAVIAAYAALFESSISDIVAIDPPSTHRNGPHLLGVLKVTDIPDSLGMLAPRKLTIVTPNADAFSRTAAAYSAAGQKERFEVRSK